MHPIVQTERDIDECLMCDDGGYAEYNVKCVDFKKSMNASCVVKKYGGNFVSLQSDHLNFETETMKCDDEATALVHRYFPEVAKQASAEVCSTSYCLFRTP
jgi:hypothetical protein